jgi:hypothetical protein
VRSSASAALADIAVAVAANSAAVNFFMAQSFSYVIFGRSQDRRQPIGTWLQPVKLSGAREKVAKKTYIRLPKYPLAALDKAVGECKADKSWTVLENTTSGHSVMINEPDWLTNVLLQAV